MEFLKRYKQDESHESEGSGVIGYGVRRGDVGRNRNDETALSYFYIYIFFSLFPSSRYR